MGLWDALTGQVNVNQIGDYYTQNRGAINSAWGNQADLMTQAAGQFSGMDAPLDLASGAAKGMMFLAKQDMTGDFRRNLREDLAASMSGQLSALRGSQGGLNQGLAAAQMGNMQSQIGSGMGKALGDFQIGQRAMQGQLMGQAGNIYQGIAGLHGQKGSTLAGILGNYQNARGNAYTNYYSNMADSIGTARMSNATNQSNFLSGLISAGGTIAGLKFLGG